MNPSTDTQLETALYVVATPIGNLHDLSQRAVAVLTSVGLIAAEDTRRTRRLLAPLGRHGELISAHSHNERAAAGKILAQLADGVACALVSDAGTPAVSDPGARLVAAVHDAGFRVIPIPGPSAITTLLSAAGIDADRFGPAADTFYFAGFLPARPTPRRAILQQLTKMVTTVVVLEAPHRIEQTLTDISDTFGPERWIVIGRELTKRYEQIAAMPAGNAPQWLASDSNHLRGEFVIALAPPFVSAATADGAGQIDADSKVQIDMTAGELLSHLQQFLPASRAVKLAQTLTGMPHKTLYALTLARKETDRDNAHGAGEP